MTTENNLQTIQYDASAAAEFQQQALVMLKAADIVIQDDMQLEMASDTLKMIKKRLKELEEKRKSVSGPLTKAAKALNDLFKVPKENYEAAEGKLKKAIIAYQDAQNALIEQKRIEAERQAAAEREKMIVEAQAASEEGDVQKAANYAMAAQLIAPVAVTETKAEGTSVRVSYKAEVTDFQSLVAAVAAGTVDINVLGVNQSVLDSMARDLRKEGPMLPGVQCVAVKTLAVR